MNCFFPEIQFSKCLSEIKNGQGNIREYSNSKFIQIDENLKVGDKVTILSGIHIGDGAVIGANSVVTKDVPRAMIFAMAVLLIIVIAFGVYPDVVTNGISNFVGGIL